MRDNFKVCICTFHNGFGPGEVGGASSAPIYLADQLRRYIKDVDLITLRDNKNYKSPLAEAVEYHSNPSILSNYDFVIFSSPGLTYEKYNEATPDKYIDVLNHTKKFTFICHEENDRKLYPYHMNFLNHPNMTFVMFNCPGMADCFDDYIDICGDWEYVSFSPLLPPKEKILEKAKKKSNKIMSTCRWTTAKRIYEYLSMSDDFVKNGIEVYAAGSHQSYWYNLKMEELPTESYHDLGYFEPSQVPRLLEDVKYHWNFLFLMRNMGLRNHQPRVEIATMEAIREGCLPVLCQESTPDWLGFNSAIRVSKTNYKDLPDILGSLSEEERLERVSTLYDLVEENILSHYETIVNHIDTVVNET